jgi:hypothetical protein
MRFAKAATLAAVLAVFPQIASAQTANNLSPTTIMKQTIDAQPLQMKFRNLANQDVAFLLWAANQEAGQRYFGFANLLADDLRFLSANTITFRAPTSVVQMQVHSTGVTIGTNPADASVKLTVNGALDVKGNIAAKYQDVAEWVPAIGAPKPGTVVILAEDMVNHVIASQSPYDTRVAGVISEQPGVILGEAAANKVQVATTGRVKVMVDADAAPIKAGDLLVTSDKPGVAMKSIPVELGGIQFHRPGTLVGKALEPLEKGTGEILVLLSLQ